MKWSSTSLAVRVCKLMPQLVPLHTWMAIVWNNQNCHPLVMGIESGTTTLKYSLLMSYKIHSLNTEIQLLGFYSVEIETSR